jgi:hypothetical protein
MRTKILIIAGMHRSGTSLVSQWLYRCGLCIGEKLVPAAIGNSDGHFEDAEFLEIHERLLRNRHLPASGFTSKKVEGLSPDEKTQLRSLIDEKNRHHEEWGWKEPRTCLFLNEYKTLLPSAVYLVVVRNYNETVNSMLSREYTAYRARFRKRKGLARMWWMVFRNRSREETFRRYATRYLEIWIRYYENILDHILALSPEQYMVVGYNYLASQDKRVFDYLTGEWNFKLNYVPFTNVFKKEMLTESIDISPFIKDSRLLQRAKKIDRMISQLLDP